MSSAIAEPEVIAPATPPVAPAPEKPSVVTFERDAAKLTPDVLSGLTPKWSPPKMFARPNANEPAPAAPAPVVAPAPEVPAAPAASPAPAAEVPAAPAEPAAPPAIAPLPPGVTPIDPNSPDFPKNWKQKANDAKEALVFQLHKQGAPLVDAMREVYGEAQPAAVAPVAPAAPEPTLPDPVEKADQHITGLAAQVAELEAKIDEVAADDPKTALKLTRQQSDLKLELATAKTQREAMAREIEDRQVSRAVETHRQLEDQSLAEMYGRYPKLNEKSSEERAAFNVKVAQLEKNPAFGPRFRDTIPGWPLMVAQMVDAEKGWSRTPATPPPGAPAPAPAPAATPMNQPNNPLAPRAVVAPLTVPPVRATSAELLSTSASPGSATPALDAKTFWKDSADVTPDQLLALMKHAPVDPRLTSAQKNDPRRFE